MCWADVTCGVLYSGLFDDGARVDVAAARVHVGERHGMILIEIAWDRADMSVCIYERLLDMPVHRTRI